METSASPPRVGWIRRQLYKSESMQGLRLLILTILFMSAAILVPFCILVMMSFWTQTGFPFDPTLTTATYQNAMERPIYGALLQRSLWISGITTICTVLLCYPMDISQSSPFRTAANLTRPTHILKRAGRPPQVCIWTCTHALQTRSFCAGRTSPDQPSASCAHAHAAFAHSSNGHDLRGGDGRPRVCAGSGGCCLESLLRVG